MTDIKLKIFIFCFYVMNKLKLLELAIRNKGSRDNPLNVKKHEEKKFE